MYQLLGNVPMMAKTARGDFGVGGDEGVKSVTCVHRPNSLWRRFSWATWMVPHDDVVGWEGEMVADAEKAGTRTTRTMGMTKSLCVGRNKCEEMDGTKKKEGD